MISKLSLCGLGLVAAAVAFDQSIATAAAARLQCDAQGPADTSMQARFERRDGGRRKFNTQFEAAPGGAFTPGQRMIVLVADVKVGAVRLKTVIGGDVGGELQLDDAAGPGDDEKPFPADFPPVQRNTNVQVKIGGDILLGCRLQ
jgi:hypothetical protein